MDVITRHCSACGAERRFEQPPCPDGHGTDCPEWACVDCGHAMLIAAFPQIDGSADRFAASSRPGHPASRTDHVHVDQAGDARSRAA